mgnify:CR=1 FL=1|tara:strand:- start:675 stop:2549 length:1875 start_codon:yes stop_codon:yes gene_type:complete
MSVYSSLASGSSTQNPLFRGDGGSILTIDPNQIQIGEIDYVSIRQSIIDYMKNTEGPLKDYDFEGSAMGVLIDAVAYNTLYYAFYSNMIANELYIDTAQRRESLVSLTKPLGFVVPQANSARASLALSNVNSRIPKYSRFTGTDGDGRGYSFFSLRDYDPDVDGNINEVIIFEAQNLVLNRDVTEQIDLINQELTIFDQRLDINSLSVEVSADGGSTFTEYVRSSFVNYAVNEESRIYFVENVNKGVKLKFSVRGDGLYASENTNLNTDNVGRKIKNTDIVRVSYVIPTGQAANGIRRFTSSAGGTVTLRTPSFGGSEGPDLNLVKFFAPKWFAAQDRAVTKDDYRVAVSDLFPPNVDPDESLVVFGGEETDPPYYGRVFVSFALDEEVTTVLESSSEILNTLREKSPVGIVPEYLQPTNVNLNLNYSFSYFGSQTQRNTSQLEAAVRNAVNNLYGRKKFNTIFHKNDLISAIREVDPAIAPIDQTDVTFSVSRSVTPATAGNTEFSFKNKLNRGFPGSAIQSDTFTSPKFEAEDVFIQDSGGVIDQYGFGSLRLVTRADTGLVSVVSSGGVGRVNYNTGRVIIFPNIFTGEITVTSRNTGAEYQAKQETILNVLQSRVTVTEL